MSKKKRKKKKEARINILWEVKTDYVLIKNLNTFLYEYTLHRARKHFCRYSLQCFRTAETIDMSLKAVLKLIVKKELSCPKKGEYIRWKKYETNIKKMLLAVIAMN